MNTQASTKGFTIIEVALVLAIAGLIFLMVFFALPQMQRTQRDATRKSDVMLFVEAVKKYQSNNRGTLPSKVATYGNIVQTRPEAEVSDPTTWEGFYHDYLETNFTDPLSGESYLLKPLACNNNHQGDTCTDYEAPDVVDYTLYIYTQATCDGDHPIAATNPRDFAVIYRTESSGVYCYNS